MVVYLFTEVLHDNLQSSGDNKTVNDNKLR